MKSIENVFKNMGQLFNMANENSVDSEGKTELIMDKITRYVMVEGFNDKLRELREEFFTKQDFRIHS